MKSPIQPGRRIKRPASMALAAIGGLFAMAALAIISALLGGPEKH